jgi:nitrogen fixation/metabolism regulation signal transduction histidine kinase
MSSRIKEKLSSTKSTFEDRLVKIALVGSMVPTVVSFFFIATSELSIYLRMLLIFVICVVVAYAAFIIRQQVIFQLRTSTNLVEAMTSGDYSLRANNKHVRGALSDFNQLLNKLAVSLSTQSLISRERQILLSKVTDQIDVAIVAADQHNNISLMNPAAERLFQKQFSSIQGWPIYNIGLQDVAKQSLNKVTEFEIDHAKRKVYVRTDTYFELGEKHCLIFITDIHHLLRDEERLAWQKLLRVLSHEINNSLTPIASISETLSQVTLQEANANRLSSQAKQNLSEGLAVITERAHSLNHFIQEYQQLSRLPLPNKTIFQLLPFTQQIVQLFDNENIILPSSDIGIYADSEQLQQVMVNLLKNAREANYAKSKSASLSITIDWQVKDQFVSISISDQGAGINNADNLFVPFYSTKKHGSGIGLSLSRQIALNHGGDLRLSDYSDNDTNNIVGAQAVLSLPLLSFK